jgi:hypothetical protein
MILPLQTKPAPEHTAIATALSRRAEQHLGMDRFSNHMPSFTGNGDGASSQQPQQSGGPGKPPGGPPAKQHTGCADVKPRLTKEQHDILEAHFQTQNKPSTSTKKGFADTLNVPVDKINVSD